MTAARRRSDEVFLSRVVAAADLGVDRTGQHEKLRAAVFFGRRGAAVLTIQRKAQSITAPQFGSSVWPV